jgi:hypothetical protein
MGQRSIAPYLSLKESSVKEIDQGLVPALGAGAVAYPRVTWYLRAAKCPAQRSEAPDQAGVKRTYSADAAILKVLTRQFHFFRALVMTADLPIQIGCPSASDGIAWLYCSPSSLDPPSAVRRSEDNQGQLVSRAPASAMKAAHPWVAGHLDSG